MAFNVGDYVNSAVKSPAERIVGTVVGQVSFGVGQEISKIAGSLAGSLFNGGSALGTIASIAAQKVDSVIAGGSSDYSGMSGKCVQRASASDIAAGRSATSIDSKKYSTQVSPQGVIARETSLYHGANTPFLQYPDDLGIYQIQFDFKTYKRPTPFVPVTSDTKLSIFLPIPAELKEFHHVDYQTNELGLVGDIADALGRGVSGGSSGISNVGDEFSGGGAAGLLRASHATTLTNAATVAEQYFGVAANPNISISFRGPSLRTHTFAWTFAPRSPGESEKIQKIISAIKNNCLPKSQFGHNSALLAYPDMVSVKLLPNQIYEFKTCVIEDIHVSYSLNGIPSFFKGTNLPTFIHMSLHLQELEYFLNEGTDSKETTFNEAGITQFLVNGPTIDSKYQNVGNPWKPDPNTPPATK